MDRSLNDYVDNLHELMRRIEAIIMGEDAMDAAFALSAICTRAVYCSQKTQQARRATLRSLVEGMRCELENMEIKERGDGRMH